MWPILVLKTVKITATGSMVTVSRISFNQTDSTINESSNNASESETESLQRGEDKVSLEQNRILDQI